MNKKIINACMFLTGAAIGSVVTWKICKKKYEQIANEEIESVKAKFSIEKIEETKVEETKEENVAEQETDSQEVIEDQRSEYSSMVQEEEYNHSNVEEVKKKTVDPSPIYVIPPESFGEMEDYEITSLTYYADGVLADEMDDVVENIDELVGEDSLTHFGEFEDDAVHVRNDNLCTDFEILRDLRNYSDVFRRESGLNDND